MVESSGCGKAQGRGVEQEWSSSVAFDGGGHRAVVVVSPQGVGDAWRRRGRARRSTSYKHVPHREKTPTAVARRNARERRRVEAVNGAFLRLRRAVPLHGLSSGGNVERSKRVSKVKTLHRAIEYIARLQDIVRDTGCCITMDTFDSTGSNLFGQREIVHDRDAMEWRGEFDRGLGDTLTDYLFGIMQSFRNES